MHRLLKYALALPVALLITVPAFAANPMVGGHAMSRQRNIVQNAVNSSDHTILVKAVKQAGLAKALEGSGPYTVFAPTNAAFHKLPSGTLHALMQNRNRARLKKILLYHVVKGDLTYHKLWREIRANGGSARLQTLEGGTVTARTNGPHNIVIEDGRGDVAHISTYDVRQSNGVIQVVDHVLLPPKS
ncbi:MAG TPA: fasciclin domain-containing protein [Gammaproteobacteria bacterium]|nr:fasciclin domain-containing protein [Gammaproteobacteria bacterium]